jgi:2-polyprenyl-3-methyl-5-hydroxy-6-metoxy-1,4-benzoquinol methylase
MFDKKIEYFENIRSDIISLVDKGENKILEIGCGTGNTGLELKQQGKAVEIVGVDIVPEVLEIAKSKIDKTICADIETLKLPFSNEYFDYILLGDVLEHLKNPWQVLLCLTQFIKKRGFIIASIPNIRYWKVIMNLVFKGEWKYSSDGVLDNTHLRFFAKKSMLELISSANLKVRYICPATELQPPNLCKKLNHLTFGLFEDFLTISYIIKAQKE